MAEGPDSAYAPGDRRKAIVTAALFGWLGVTVLELRHANGGEILFFLPFFAIIGLPIAFLSVWLIGGPILRLAMRHPINWVKAAAVGALIATIIAAISIVLDRLNGLRAYNDPTFHFQLGGGDYVREVDGILTPYGWLLVAQNTAIFIGLGAAIGLVVRATLGPGNRLPKA
jgi:hypothetical protein